MIPPWLDQPEPTETLFGWLDKVPLSRERKQFKRDFADGVLVAEIIHHFFPDWIDLHNYIPSSKLSQKEANWRLLHRKVLTKFNIRLTEKEIKCLAQGVYVDYLVALIRAMVAVVKCEKVINPDDLLVATAHQ